MFIFFQTSEYKKKFKYGKKNKVIVIFKNYFNFAENVDLPGSNENTFLATLSYSSFCSFTTLRAICSIYYLFQQKLQKYRQKIAKESH